MYKRYVRWLDDVWNDYTQLTSNKYVNKINQLIRSIQRDGFSRGLGKPEPLKGYYSKKNYKAWSRRIDKKNRLIYLVDANNITIISCRGHYHDD